VTARDVMLNEKRKTVIPTETLIEAEKVLYKQNFFRIICINALIELSIEKERIFN
jgi:hypothetical protein